MESSEVENITAVNKGNLKMKKIIKKLVIGLVAGGIIYGGMQFTANTMVDEALTTKHIKAVEKFLGGSLTYQGAGVDAKFSPILKKIEISELLPIPGSKLLIENITINEMKGLNFNINLNKVSMLVYPDTILRLGLFEITPPPDFLSKSADITVINKCENDRCNLTMNIKVDGVASVRIELGSSRIKSISEALAKIDLKSKPIELLKAELIKELEETANFTRNTVEEFTNLYKIAHKGEQSVSESMEAGKFIPENTIESTTKQHHEEERRKTLFSALNEKLVREAPSKEVKGLLVLINELNKADVAISVKISKLDDSEGETNLSQINNPNLELIKFFKNRFKDFSISVEKESDNTAFGISLNGKESSLNLSISVSSPTIVEMAQINDQDSYNKVVSKITFDIKSDVNSKGLGLTSKEITQIIDLVNIFRLPIPNRNELELWLLANLDKITAGKGNSNLAFNAGTNKLITRMMLETPLFDYDDNTISTIHKGNFGEELLEKLSANFKFKDLMDVIYSGIKAVSGEDGYQAITAQRDILLGEDAILAKISELKNSDGIDVSKFFASMGINSNEDLAKAIEHFVKNPGLIKINFSYPDSEKNPIIAIMYPNYAETPSKGKNPIQSLDKYLTIEIHPEEG